LGERGYDECRSGRDGALGADNHRLPAQPYQGKNLRNGF